MTGGGGEYGGGATGGDSWNGGGYTAPYPGDTYGEADLDTIFFGSGGGGTWNGGTDDPLEDPGPGGDGGGIVFIGAAYLVADGADAITSIGGTTYHWSHGTWEYGAAGGAGGSIYLIAHDLTLAADAIDATGGFGEDTHERIGGDGGVGRIRIDYDVVNGYAYGEADALLDLQTASDPDPGYVGPPV